MKPLTSNLQHPPSKSLRIGLDAKRAFNNGTGLGNYSRFVINGLIKHFPQHEYFLFTPSIKAEYEQFYPKHSNVQLVTPESLLGKSFPSLWRTYAIAEMCTKLKLDVFHGLSNELPLGIESFTGKKIVTIHDLIFLRYPNYYNNIDRYIYTRKFKYACSKADIVIAASEQTKSDIIQYFHTSESNIVVGYQNCDTRFETQATELEKATLTNRLNLPAAFVLCVGTIEQRKNQLTVLKAFFEANLDQMSLVFVGKETDYANALHTFIKEHKLESKVLFLKNIAAADLPVLYQLAKVFVYASEFEGFGIPVLEGLRSGLPVLAANSSSLPEVGGLAAHYFQHNNPTQLTELLQKVLATDYHKPSYSKHLQQFDTQHLISQLEAWYAH
jgi:glycosyltransferase involved in cell wall biosynthesis